MTRKKCSGEGTINVKHSPNPDLIGSVIIQCPDCCSGISKFDSYGKRHYDIPCDKCAGIGYINKKVKMPLKPCPFCEENFQLQVIKVDAKNTGRDLIKCRKCKGQAPRKYWQGRV